MAVQARQAARRSASTDRGVTLVEIVITIALLGTVVIAVLTAVQTGIKSSSVSRELAQIQTVLLNSADRVNRAPKGCGHMSGGSYVPYYRQFVIPAVNLQWPEYSGNVTVTEQHFVPPPAHPTNYTLQDPGTWAAGGCALNDPQPLEVQLVTITITTPDGSSSRSIEVVKSDV